MSNAAIKEEDAFVSLVVFVGLFIGLGAFACIVFSVLFALYPFVDVVPDRNNTILTNGILYGVILAIQLYGACVILKQKAHPVKIYAYASTLIPLCVIASRITLVVALSTLQKADLRGCINTHARVDQAVLGLNRILELACENILGGRLRSVIFISFFELCFDLFFVYVTFRYHRSLVGAPGNADHASGAEDDYLLELETYTEASISLDDSSNLPTEAESGRQGGDAENRNWYEHPFMDRRKDAEWSDNGCGSTEGALWG